MDDTIKRKSRKYFTRRNLLIGSAVAAFGFAWSKKPKDLSGDKLEYFEALSGALKRAGIGKPTLIIDRQRLHHNVATVMKHIPNGVALRVAQKSVPSLGLMKDILTRAQTDRLMVFNKDYLQSMILEQSDYQILLGKPLPIAAVKNFYDFADGADVNIETLASIEWLIDTPERLKAYAELAQARDITLKINIELDVGMHRGGVKDEAQLEAMLRQTLDDTHLIFSGFMGYEKHIVYALGGAKAQDKAKEESWATYRRAVKVAQNVFGPEFDASNLTLDGGGSATYQLYKDSETINDICLGSAFTMPSHFDFESLSDHMPAAFIASPVIKQSMGLKLPGGGVLNDLIQMWDPNRKQTIFYYGGRWMADPVYPQGLVYNELYGRSSNQEMLNGSKDISINPDDFIFFRPQESEAVFLQFGDIAVFEDGEITEFWPVLDFAP